MSATFRSGEPVWVELCTAYPDQAEAFFEGLFGWQARHESLENGTYCICESSGRDVAGICDASLLHEGRRHGWITYFAVDDMDRAIARGEALGATVLLDPRHLPAAGTGATMRDPHGAAFGLYQAGARQGVQALNSVGSLCWNEISTGNPTESASFYRELLGFSVEHQRSAMGQPYSLLKLDDQPVAGLLSLESAWPNVMPARWVPYFSVASLRDAVDRVAELGGYSLLGPVASPNGSLNVVRDAEENSLYLIELEATLRRDLLPHRRQVNTND